MSSKNPRRIVRLSKRLTALAGADSASAAERRQELTKEQRRASAVLSRALEIDYFTWMA